MTIPKDLTHAEVGALLVAVGNHMIEHNVCADAVLERELLCSNEYYRLQLARALQENALEYMPIERALEIIHNLNLDEAIDFVEGHTT